MPEPILWEEYAHLYDPARPLVPAADLVDLSTYRLNDRLVDGINSLGTLAAYAQDSLVYDPQGQMVKAESKDAYKRTDPNQRVNKFGEIYRSQAPSLLHHALADILVDAAIYMQRYFGWTTFVFDGLRTVEAAYLMYVNADAKWREDGLIATPGTSAHNRGLAVDTAMFDAQGLEVDLGAHLDHSDMEISSRNYHGNGISLTAKRNRLRREIAFQAAAINRGTVIAPLRSEFWDDRMPGSDIDLWRVIESLKRCLGEVLPSEEQRAKDYKTFARQWQQLNKEKMLALFGGKALEPPPYENIIFHEKLNPIYDRDLPEAMRLAVMDPAKLPDTENLRGA